MYYSYDARGHIIDKSPEPFPEGMRQAQSNVDYGLENYIVVIGQVKEGRITAASTSPKPVAVLIQNIQQKDKQITALETELEGIRTAMQEGLAT